MDLGKIFSRNKNLLSVILGIILIGYLYLEVPIPLVHIFNDTTLFIIILLFFIFLAFIFNKVHIIVILLAIIVLYEIIKKYKTNSKEESKKTVFSQKKNTGKEISTMLNDKVTLEETIVQNMVPIVKHAPPHPTPRYQGITGDLSQTSPI